MPQIYEHNSLPITSHQIYETNCIIQHGTDYFFFSVNVSLILYDSIVPVQCKLLFFRYLSDLQRCGFYRVCL